MDGRGPVYMLSTQVMLLTDLVEHLLRREHEHSGARPAELQRFTSSG